MNAPAPSAASSPARLRRVLVAIVLLVGVLGVLGYLYGGWLLKNPPTKEQAEPGH